MKALIASSVLALVTTSAIAQDVTRTLPYSVARVAPALNAYSTDDLVGSVWAGESMSMRDRALVTFAALMTRHEVTNLSTFGELALDAGVTPAELSETITHLAFYTGWGNATAATEALAPIYEARGIAGEDLPSADPDLLPLNKVAEAARQSTVQGNFGSVSHGVVDNTEQLLFLDLWLRPALKAATAAW